MVTNSHNISNVHSFSKFFSVSDSGNANKKEPLSEEEKNMIERKRKERKAEYDRIRNEKPENKEKRREYDRIRNEKPVNKEKRREYDRMRNEKPENKEKRKEYNRISNEKPERKVKRIEYERMRYAKDKEKRRETSRQYMANNKQKVTEANRMRYANNKEKIRKANRIRYANNKEKIKEEFRRWYIRKMKKINSGYVHNPLKREYDWKVKYSVKSFFEKVGKKLKIIKKSDWYHVSIAQIRENGGGGALARYGSLGFALKFAYPRYKWDMERFQYFYKLAAQRHLRLMLEELLPKGIVLEYNFTKDPALYLEGSTSNYPTQYDFFIKEWRLAIEYQGEQHYLDIRPKKAPLSERQKKDAAKLASAVKHGIVLVWIPYWWNKKRDSLSSTLNQYMPDRFPKTDSPPIPTELPPDYQKNKKPQLTNKNIMMGYDLETCANEIDVKGWFMSEKLDGIRAFWDGKGNFWSKNGKIINVPESFKQLPPYPLDGELWCGYEDNGTLLAFLKQCCDVVRKKTWSAVQEWEKIKFCVFDAPNVEAPYDKRHLFLENNLTQYFNSKISLVPIQKCKGKEDLQNHLDQIVKKGGEGIMIYNPVSHYHAGRCKNVLKVKKYYESTITFLERSKDSYHFKCQQNDGSEVFLKVMGGYYMRPPKINSKIPVKHQGFFTNSQNFKYPVLIEPLSVEEKKQARKQAEKKAKKLNINIE
jgi:DNA ligase-1